MLAVPAPRQFGVTNAVSALGRAGGHQVVAQNLHQPNAQLATEQVPVHGVELCMPLVELVVCGDRVPRLLPVYQVLARALHRGASGFFPRRSGGEDRDRRHVAFPQRVVEDVVDVVVVADQRVGHEHLPVQAVGRGGDHQAAVAEPTVLVASRPLGEVRPLVNYGHAEVHWPRLLDDLHRADPMDAVLRFHGARAGGIRLAVLGTDVVPNPKTSRLGVPNHRHVGRHAAALFAGDDRVGDLRVALWAVDPASHVLAACDQVIVHQQMRSRAQANRFLSPGGPAGARPVDARIDGLVAAGA